MAPIEVPSNLWMQWSAALCVYGNQYRMQMFLGVIVIEAGLGAGLNLLSRSGQLRRAM